MHQSDVTTDRVGLRISRRTLIRRATLLACGAALLSACAPQTPVTPTQAPAAGAAKPTEPAKPAEAAKPAAPTTAPVAGKPAESKPAEAAAGQPKRGGTYTHGSVQEPDRFWGPITGLVVSTEVAHLTNSPLIKVNEKLEYVPALATQVPALENGGISQDGLTYTFKLRSDVKWSDGTPFTSADVKLTYDVMVMPGVDVRGRVGWDQITKVETPDPTTVVYTFKAVDASFLDRVAAVHILPKHVFDGLDAQAINQHQWFRAPKPWPVHLPRVGRRQPHHRRPEPELLQVRPAVSRHDRLQDRAGREHAAESA